MFDKFAATDAKKAARTKSSPDQDGKDVFTKAEEEAKARFTDETVPESIDEAKNVSETDKDKNNEDKNSQDKEKGKVKESLFSKYLVIT